MTSSNLIWLITSSNWLDLDLVAKHCENQYVAKDDKIILSFVQL